MTTSDDGGCACCAGITDQTPVRLGNRPGLSEIVYRTGRYSTFRASMVAGLTSRQHPALADLRTRDTTDFSLALIDAWAVAADVLTFYTERVANEGYLGTATERRSVSGLVGLIGYRLGRGVAAQTSLAFSLATSPGSPAAVPVPRGAKVQTLPGPGELPQTFETVEELTALAEWNAPLVRQTEPRVPRNGDPTVLLAGAAAGVSRGDTLLFLAANAAAGSGFCLVRVSSVRPDPAHGRTEVGFAPKLSGLDTGQPVRVHAMRQRAAVFGYNAPSPLMFVKEVKEALLAAEQVNAEMTEWVFEPVEPLAVDLDAVYDGVTVGSPVVLTGGGATTSATVSGIGEATRTAYGMSAKVTRLALEPTDVDLSELGEEHTRTSSVLLRGEELTVAEVPVVAPVHGDSIELAGPVDADLPRTILVRGRRPRLEADPKAGIDVVLDEGGDHAVSGAVDDVEGTLTVLAITPVQQSPGTWVVRVETDQGRSGTVTAAAALFAFLPAAVEDPVVGETAQVVAIDGATLELADPLVHVYDRATVSGGGVEIWGNVATATHGESTVDEVLGSGDAAQGFQRFTLRRPPLTHVQAATASGNESTLVVSVDEVRWHEVPTLFGHGPSERVYTTTTTDEGKTVVQFGDGVHGARPPTGLENIRATYRTGVGLSGLAAADQLSLLMTRPLGVTAVRNPLAATGAQDPQVAADAAADAPRTVLTLDRIVSLRDYEDFAAGVGGVGKAAATWTWDGVVRGVALTVAGVGGATIDPAGSLLETLSAAVHDAGDPRVPLVILPAEVGRITLEAALVLDPDHLPEPLLQSAHAALLDHFSFARRGFGQLVSLGEVDEVLHAVRGVNGVLVSRLHRSGETALRNPYLLARSLVPGRPPATQGAEVLTIDPDQILLGVT